jgi:hypothetical protein
MDKVVLALVVFLAAQLMGIQEAFAVPPQAAPAPLFAAGIPAFAALGGGVLVSRLFRKRKGNL